jgi:predicted RNA-binding Zn-ribbon protein involved in translation (DUF1610 family)
LHNNAGDIIKSANKKRCSFCGAYMTYHIFGERVYWICPECGNGEMTSKNAEIVAGNILELCKN